MHAFGKIIQANVLSWLEDINRPDWQRLNLAVDARLSGHSPSEVRASSWDYGPFYNVLDKHGLPIFGALAHCNLPDGVGELVRIVGSAAGDIDLQFMRPRKDIGPLISVEDVNVALAVVFGYPKPWSPYISIETENDGLGTRELYHQLKVWEPDYRVTALTIERTAKITPSMLGKAALGDTLAGIVG